MTLGKRVRQRRRQLGLTQTELAKRVGVKRGTIADLERNARHVVGSDTLKKLAQVLGCTTDFLVGMYEDEDSQQAPTETSLVGA